MRWQELAVTSHYRTAVAIEGALKRNDLNEAAVGLHELIEALARCERRALRGLLIRLMAHVIQWRQAPSARCRAWRAHIRNCRREIACILAEAPCLSRTDIEWMWPRCLEAAHADAEDALGKPCPMCDLSWSDVFEAAYDLQAQG